MSTSSEGPCRRLYRVHRRLDSGHLAGERVPTSGTTLTPGSWRQGGDTLGSGSGTDLWSTEGGPVFLCRKYNLRQAGCSVVPTPLWAYLTTCTLVRHSHKSERDRVCA